MIDAAPIEACDRGSSAASTCFGTAAHFPVMVAALSMLGFGVGRQAADRQLTRSHNVTGGFGASFSAVPSSNAPAGPLRGGPHGTIA